jgi:hypothetical protein
MRRLVLIVALLAACGTEDPDDGMAESIFPLAVGNQWVFRVQDEDGDLPMKTQTITSTAPDGAFRFETVRGDGGDRVTYSVQKIDDEGRLIRLSERSTKLGIDTERITFVPYDIRVDTDSYQLGHEYEQTYLEDHDPSDGVRDVMKSQTFVVEAIDETVTVPAGTFRTIKIRRTTVDGPAKTYWYAKGVGKVMEVGGQNEQLASYQVEGSAE